jgi:uncharacterized protein DUF3800
MKFAYVDETGTGDGTSVIVVSIVVDAHRMHITKKDWDVFVDDFAKQTGKKVKELHFRDFYKGRDQWSGLPGDRRAAGITFLLDWLAEGKHKVTFSAVHRGAFDGKVKAKHEYVQDVANAWRAAALHVLLQLQKEHQKQKSNKGHTVLIFDREDRDEKELINLFRAPPTWTDTYYERGKKQEQLDQFVDVPYFADSEHVLLVQAADMIAYLLGRHTKLIDDKEAPAYADETKRIARWIEQIQSILLPTAGRYPKKARCECADFYWELCPASLREL